MAAIVLVAVVLVQPSVAQRVVVPPVPAQGTARAQDDCVDDREPNDVETDLGTSPAASGSVCVEGTMPDGDQDLFLWELSADAAQGPWTLTLEGVEDTLTGLQVRRIDSEPGVDPVMVGAQLLALESPPGLFEPATLTDVLLPPGAYLLGVSRSPTASGRVPQTLGYTFSIRPGAALPPSADSEPNDDVEQASPIHGAFNISGDLQATYDVFAWTIEEEAGVWTLSGEGVQGSTLRLDLYAPDGTPLVAGSGDAMDRLVIPDLRLSPGVYQLILSGGSEGAFPYRLTSTAGPLTGDPEPNDAREQATDTDTAQPLTRSRLGREGDVDYYRMSVPAGADPIVQDVRLIWQAGPWRELCLETGDGVSLQCRSATDGTSLDSLTLLPGDYLLSVKGERGANDGYVLRIDPTSARVPDFEAEPNDVATLATSFDASIVMHGRGAAGDRDHLELTVAGEPQLWEVAVDGSAIEQLSWLLADGTHLAAGDVTADRTGARLTDLYLTPGQHVFRVDASAGDYTFAATPLGPPDPNAEREPNNDVIHAEPYRMGTERVGRLPGPSDIDLFRFSLSATEHVLIRVQSPPDGSADLALETSARRIADRFAPAPGATIEYDALLYPGDYELWLRPSQPSTQRYRLTMERLDPFMVADDQEPNDDPSRAGPFPTGGTLEGRGGFRTDEDWFRLLPSTDGAPISVTLEGEASQLSLSDGIVDIPLTESDGTGAWLSDPPPIGVPLYLAVLTDGDAPYRVSLGVARPRPPTVAPDPPFELELEAERETVAAFWPEGQRIDGVLRMTNTSAADLSLDLDVHTTHFAWTAEPQVSSVLLPPGVPVELPVEIRTLPDAWADDTVRVTVRARDADGAFRTAFADITPGRDALPASPEPAWPIPAALLGGLDVASTALGASPAGAFDPLLESELHDGLSHVGLGWWLGYDSWVLPVTLTMDLAGDGPVPVAGTIIDPQALDTLQSEVPRRFTLLLSTDGVTWQEALAGELSPYMGEQPFVLDAPVAASFAQLRIDSSYGAPASDRLALGEWKVVAAPGVVPVPEALNLADPRLGGHVTWHEPMQGDPYFPEGLLSEDATPQSVSLGAGEAMSWVVGFREDRAAQIVELQWLDAPGSEPGGRFDRIELEASLKGPVGPWQPLGSWRLKRAADGSVAPFVLPEPTWARFVRFTGDAPRRDAYAWQMPATLRVLERAADSEYHSILGEWGAGSSAGPFELAQPAPQSVAEQDAPDGDDTPDTARVLQAGDSIRGRVDRGEDVDWYAMTVPATDNTLTIDLAGRPILAVGLTLVDEAGLEVPMLLSPTAQPGTIRYSAEVTPGATYRVRAEQPVSSVVITFDTSFSLGSYLPLVFEGMRAFTADVVPGEEEVLVMPFEEEPILATWSDLPYELQNAVSGYLPFGLSSGAEAALIDASDHLSARQGARAVLLVTDAETSSYALSGELWDALSAVRPLVFAVHVGAQTTPLLSEQLMQDWTAASGGFYQYARSHGELDRAFDRLATWLRRPAAYALAFETAFLEAPPPSRKPGSLRVVAPAGQEGEALSAVSPEVGIEIILDTSGSMLQRAGGQRRIDLATSVLMDLVETRIPAGTPVALRVLGDRDRPCGTQLAAPLAPLDPARIRARVEGLQVDEAADTPIGAAIASVPGDLGGTAGTKIVLLITDSQEIWPHPDLCGVDPADAIRDLRRHGIDARLNIVGMAVSDRRAKVQMRGWARSGGGGYFDASGRDELAKAIERAVSAPFRVLDDAGNEVAAGTVLGDAVPLPPGRYSVVVLGDRVARFDAVEIGPGDAVTLTLPVPEVRVPSEGPAVTSSP